MRWSHPFWRQSGQAFVVLVFGLVVIMITLLQNSRNMSLWSLYTKYTILTPPPPPPPPPPDLFEVFRLLHYAARSRGRCPVCFGAPEGASAGLERAWDPCGLGVLRVKGF